MNRAHLLTPGTIYRVTRDIPPGLCSFTAGELVTFKSAGYSRYDEAHIYSFLDAAGELKDFALSDAHSVDRLMQAFEASGGLAPE